MAIIRAGIDSVMQFSRWNENGWHSASCVIGQDGYKPNTWYTFTDEGIVEAPEPKGWAEFEKQAQAMNKPQRD